MSEDQKGLKIKKALLGSPKKRHSYPGALIVNCEKAYKILDVPLSFLEGIWADAECIIIEGKIEKMKSNSHSIILPF